MNCKNSLIMIFVLAMLCGCQKRRQADGGIHSESSEVLGKDNLHSPFRNTPEGLEYDLHYSDSTAGVLDSLLAFLYIDADTEKKASHEWEWAKHARNVLGKGCDYGDLKPLDDISRSLDEAYEPLLAYSQYDINTATSVFAATARFRMLNAYQVLDSLMSETSLPEGGLQKDYTLWENVFREIENHNTTGRSSGTMILNTTYVTLADLRCSVLMEEIGYISGLGKRAEWYVNADELRWDSSQQVIRQWYDYRMKMADQLEKSNKNYAEYSRRMTYKVVFIYQHLQLGWMYDSEKNNF